MKRDKKTAAPSTEAPPKETTSLHADVCPFYRAHGYHHSACCLIGKTIGGAHRDVYIPMSDVRPDDKIMVRRDVRPEPQAKRDLYELVPASELQPGDRVRYPNDDKDLRTVVRISGRSSYTSDLVLRDDAGNETAHFLFGQRFARLAYRA